MLKLTLRPGEFIDIGDNVRVIFFGRLGNNIHLPGRCSEKSFIARSSRKEKDTTEPAGRYYMKVVFLRSTERDCNILMRENVKMQPDAHRKKCKHSNTGIHNNSGNMR